MSAPLYSQADYAAALQALLPRGLVWPRDPDATITAVLTALAQSSERGNVAANALLVDAFPASAVGLLPEWLSTLGVPVPGTTLAGTTAGQQAQVVAALSDSGGSTIAYFVALAASQGVAITITEYTFATVSTPVDAPYYGAGWAFSWHVVYSGGTNAALEALIRRFAPAHTFVAFN